MRAGWWIHCWVCPLALGLASDQVSSSVGTEVLIGFPAISQSITQSVRAIDLIVSFVATRSGCLILHCVKRLGPNFALMG